MNHPSFSKDKIDGLILGSLVGDALGVPVEFQDRGLLRINPVISMREFGTHNQPKGTWSDDGSMMLISLETLIADECPYKALEKFVRWLNDGYWGAHNQCFDIGNTTADALAGFMQTGRPAASTDARANGNGALMRIAPLAPYLENMDEDDFSTCRDWSTLTHGHPISVYACFFYVDMLYHILRGLTPAVAYHMAIETTGCFSTSSDFSRLLSGYISQIDERYIQSDGYVLHTLEAAVWCALNASSYSDGVLRAVNLGEDTDTTACVCGGLLGAYYGRNGIPTEWIQSLARLNDVEQLLSKV